MAFTPIKFDGRKTANVAEIDTNFQNVANDISEIESDISILPALQIDVTNNKNNIFSLQSDMSIANTDIDNLQLSVSVIPAIQNDIAEINNTLEDLNVPEDILSNSDIGVTVQGYDSNIAKNNIDNNWSAEQTVKSVKDTIYTITDDVSVDIDPANGQIQLWVLGANRTPTATNFEDGQSVTLMIDDGTAYAITWTIVDKWFGGAPTLSTSELTGIVLFKVGGLLYGAPLSEIA